MKTTKKDFERFKDAFNKCIEAYGLLSWEIIFRHEKIEDAYASVSVDTRGQLAIVCLSLGWPDNEDDGWGSHEATARHEAIHLLLANLTYLAHNRYVNSREVDVEEERMVRVLEKLLPEVER